MKTQGIQVVEGFLVIPFGRGVPDAFWGRLRRELTKAGLMEEHRADYACEREAVRRERPAGDAMTSEQTISEAEREERLFRRWVERLGLPVSRWPWERGWTEDDVDGYLTAPAAREAA